MRVKSRAAFIAVSRSAAPRRRLRRPAARAAAIARREMPAVRTRTRVPNFHRGRAPACPRRPHRPRRPRAGANGSSRTSARCASSSCTSPRRARGRPLSRSEDLREDERRRKNFLKFRTRGRLRTAPVASPRERLKTPETCRGTETRRAEIETRASEGDVDVPERARSRPCVVAPEPSASREKCAAARDAIAHFPRAMERTGHERARVERNAL